MFYGISDIAVIVATIVSLAVGSVWYSPLMFGKQWMQAVGFTEADLEASKKKMPQLFALGALANLIALYVVARLVSFSDALSMTVLELSSLIAVLIGIFGAGIAVWEQKPISYMLINFTYAVIVIVGGAHIIALWPW